MKAANSLNINEPGYVAFDGTATFFGRTFQAGTGISLTNPDGIAGNTTISSTISGGISTINGDSGSITGSTVTIFTNNVSNASGSSVLFTNSGTVSTLSVTDANLSTFIGKLAGNLTISGTENTGIGNTSLEALTSGTLNTAVGSRSAAALQNGSSNVAVGGAAMNANVSGSNNVSVGEESMLLNTGNLNTVVGAKAMGGGSGDNHDNTFIGFGAGNAITTGSVNTGVGSGALGNLLDGMDNVAIGYEAGMNYTGTETNNITIGYQQFGTTGESNVTRLGGTQTQCFVAGVTGVTVTGTAVLCSATGQFGTIVSSERYKENIQDLGDDSSKIMNLRPVKFNYKNDPLKCIKYGLIAEEVDKDFPYLTFYNNLGQPESVNYHELPALLLNEIQKLTKRIADLEKKIV